MISTKIRVAGQLTIIESPLSGDFKTNIRYTKWCMYDSLMRGEYPFASHLLYTQFLDDTDPKHRKLGMTAGFHWADCADRRAVYIDLGLTDGMIDGLNNAPRTQKLSFRKLPEDLWLKFQAGEEPGATPGF